MYNVLVYMCCFSPAMNQFTSPHEGLFTQKLIPYLEGANPTLTGLKHLLPKNMREAVIREGYSASGESAHSLAKGLGLEHMHSKLVSYYPFHRVFDATICAVKANSVRLFGYYVKSTPFDCHLLESIAVCDLDDARYTCAYIALHGPYYSGSGHLVEAFGAHHRIVHALLKIGIPKPWRTPTLLLLHHPALSERQVSLAWRAYATTCAEWTPERHHLFPIAMRQVIVCVLKLGLVTTTDGNHLCLLGTLPRELLYYLINMFCGLIHC